jgi:hypothetical protein
MDETIFLPLSAIFAKSISTLFNTGGVIPQGSVRKDREEALPPFNYEAESKKVQALT